jgi:5-methylcytosine-specific restriction endonuclease McrA
VPPADPEGFEVRATQIVSPSSKAWHERGAPAVRQQVIDRDRGCRLCGTTEELQVHHIVAAGDGGPTTPDNLIVVCRKHHQAVEDGAIEGVPKWA